MCRKYYLMNNLFDSRMLNPTGNAWYCNYIFENIRRYNGYVEAYNLVSSQRIHFNVDVFTPIKCM